MQRYNSIYEAIGRKIELYSELEPGKMYSIEGTPHQYVGHEDHQFWFKAEHATEPTAISETDLDQLIITGNIMVGGTTEFEDTVPTYPNLDKFTRNTFSSNTKPLWQAAGVKDHLSSTDLYTLDGMVQQHRLEEMPHTDERRYETLLNDENWPLLKKYLTTIEPNVYLPEELG